MQAPGGFYEIALVLNAVQVEQQKRAECLLLISGLRGGQFGHAGVLCVRRHYV